MFRLTQDFVSDLLHFPEITGASIWLEPLPKDGPWRWSQIKALDDALGMSEPLLLWRMIQFPTSEHPIFGPKIAELQASGRYAPRGLFDDLSADSASFDVSYIERVESPHAYMLNGICRINVSDLVYSRHDPECPLGGLQSTDRGTWCALIERDHIDSNNMEWQRVFSLLATAIANFRSTPRNNEVDFDSACAELGRKLHDLITASVLHLSSSLLFPIEHLDGEGNGLLIVTSSVSGISPTAVDERVVQQLKDNWWTMPIFA